MKKYARPFCHLGLFIVLLVVVGCRSSHEVSVVSHGELVPPVSSTERDSPEVFPPPHALERSMGIDAPASAVSEEKRPQVSADVDGSSAPMAMSNEPPSTSSQVGSTILAQSADDSRLPWTLEDVFFDYDKITIRQDAIPRLQQNSKVLLRRYPDREVLIQGHCDERGTEEYNLVLGERRARAVKRFLVDLGVPAAQLRVLSLGKSQPFCLQRTHACFQQNRRAHFVLK